ncbi:hypothetical protein GCM10009839_49840 [Catenulispora yoronensis]|uniref:Chitin-binding type-3 domain-containing protein n=1 Tax=Catenulispora yoronensis TaxID=450799 RepID=A0ABN2US78_9ACTN
MLAVGLAAGTAVAAGITALAVTPATAATPAPVAPNAQSLAAASADALVAARPAALFASANDQFQRQQVISSSGIQYVPYLRTYSGLPVVGGDFVVVTDSSGSVITNSVAQEHAIGSLSTTPTLTSDKGAAVASAQLKSVTKVEGTQLVVYALGTGPATLAWQTTVDGTGDDGYSRLSVDVDARTGAVLHTQEHVMHGSGTSAWNGPNPVHIDTSGSAGSYSMNTPNISNMPCQDAASNSTFTKSTDSWGNGSGSSKETGCVDALYGAQSEFKMLAQWDNRNGMDGNGGAWPIRVGLNDVNAYYDGSQVQVGHNQAGQWIGSIDVIAHEMGHGVDDHTPGGISGNGTQEFVADTFGAATEWFTNEPAPYDVPDFTVGEQINLTGSGPIRNMYNPSALGDPNCYSSSVPGGEVHSAAGPGNHWFYLVAEGTSPTNGQPSSPTCNSSTVTGVGIQNAEKIMYNAMLMKTSASSYLNYRKWTLQSAKNLDASCGLFNTVKAAWTAVSVPAQSGEATCTGTPTSDFSVSVNPSSGSVAQGGTVSTTVSTAVTTGSAQQVTLTASGLPSGVTASFNPATVTAGQSSTLTLSASSGAATGSKAVTVTGTAPSGTHTASYTVNVTTTNPGQDFSVSVSPSSATVAPGASTTASVSTATVSGAAQTVSLSVSGAPAGVTASVSPTSVTSGGSATLSVAVAATAASGTYTLTITGSGTATHTATFTLTVSGGGGGGNCAGVSAWSASSSYVPGDKVTYNGHLYKSTWYSTGAVPTDPQSWAVWSDGGAC